MPFEAMKVGELAKRTGLTVRTLHHYDEIGLLRPSRRSEAGYRLYEHGDLERLQRILAYRGLGIGLDKIAAILDDPNTDPIEHLRSQHELLLERRTELDRMITALEKTMEAHNLSRLLKRKRRVASGRSKKDASVWAEQHYLTLTPLSQRRY